MCLNRREGGDRRGLGRVCRGGFEEVRAAISNGCALAVPGFGLLGLAQAAPDGSVAYPAPGKGLEPQPLQECWTEYRFECTPWVLVDTWQERTRTWRCWFFTKGAIKYFNMPECAACGRVDVVK